MCLHVINTHTCIFVDGFASTTRVNCDHGLSIGSILLKCEQTTPQRNVKSSPTIWLKFKLVIALMQMRSPLEIKMDFKRKKKETDTCNHLQFLKNLRN